MNSDKEPSDNKIVEKINEVQEPETNTKSCSSRKILWKPSAEKETYPTVVVNYHYDMKRRSTGAIPKRREAWSQMVAAMHAKKLLNNKTEKDNSVYNLRNLYQVSKEQLESSKSGTSSSLCEAAIAKTAICSRNSNNGSRQSLKVEIYNIPTKQDTKTEDTPKIQTTKSDKITRTHSSHNATFDSCESDICCLLKANKCKSNISRNSIKVEIFNFPPLQEVVTEEIKTPTVTQILQHEPEIILISDDSDENMNKTEPEKSVLHEPTIVKDIQNIIEVAQNTTEYCNISCKSTQKPEVFSEIPTQTAFESKILQNFLQTPPFQSKLSPSKLAPTKYCISTLRQRQTELHRMRVQVEQKRLELLDLKLSREREQMEREKLLFEKGQKIKTIEFQELGDREAEI